MIEYVKKSEVLEIINSPLPRDLTAEYIFDLKGVWLEETEADTPQTENEKYLDKIKPHDPHKDWAEDEPFDADTPQTDCEACRHYKLACELFSEVCKYEPTTQTETQNSNLTFDTPQTESTGSPIGDYRDGVGAWQTERSE